jgi:hypothetical protein
MLSGRHTSTTQSLERKNSLDAYNERMGKLDTRRDEHNFNNWAIYHDIRRHDEVGERTDTLYIRNGVFLWFKRRTNLSVSFRYCGSGIRPYIYIYNSSRGWVQNISLITTMTDKLMTSNM